MDHTGFKIKLITTSIILGSVFVAAVAFVIQSQISADSSYKCLVTNEKSEIIDNPPGGAVQNCGAMQLDVGGFADCSTRDASIAGTPTIVTVTIESSALNSKRSFTPKYCQVQPYMGLPVDTTQASNRYTYSVSAPGYETAIGTVDLKRTRYTAPGSRYDGYIYYTGAVGVMYRQKQHAQGALRVSAAPFPGHKIKVTGPNGYALETVTEESAGDIENLAPGTYTIEIFELPYAGLGRQIVVPESEKRKEVQVEQGKVTFVYFRLHDKEFPPTPFDTTNLVLNAATTTPVITSTPSLPTTSVSPSPSTEKKQEKDLSVGNLNKGSTKSPMVQSKESLQPTPNAMISASPEISQPLPERLGVFRRFVVWIQSLFR